jgi:hypothetical protein
MLPKLAPTPFLLSSIMQLITRQSIRRTFFFALGGYLSSVTTARASAALQVQGDAHIASATSDRVGSQPDSSRSSTACQPAWIPTFGGEPGTDDQVYAMAVYDDGSGPALYVGGAFTGAGGIATKGIAKWSGSSWSTLGSGLTSFNNVTVNALTVFDDGTGAALYVAGSFLNAGGVAAPGIAKWNGSTWSALGSGLPTGGILAMTVFDDGTGPALYVGGTFTSVGGVAANNIAKWNGSSWSALGTGMNSLVFALTVFDAGSGPALYAGGDFTIAGGVPTRFIASWNGSAWSTLAGGEAGSFVLSLTVFNDGTGAALYAGGNFSTAGNVTVNQIAKWNGASWSALGSGMAGGLGSSTFVQAMTEYDDGSGPALYAAGSFSSAGGVPASLIAKWNGSSWSALGSGISGGDAGNPPFTRSLAAFDDGSGSALYVGGPFLMAGGGAVDRIAKWHASSWSPLVRGTSGLSNIVEAVAVFDDGNGPALYVGGEFQSAGGMQVNSIAKWNGSNWSALGSGMGGTQPYVGALTVFDDGSGPALYAGGGFSSAGGVAANNIARWNGVSWSPVGGGTTADVLSFAVFDDGGGPALYAGGNFSNAGGVLVKSIAKWNGSSWSALGTGMTQNVRALTVFDDGSGPALYAGGAFTMAGGVTVDFVGKWNGHTWSGLQNGVFGFVNALTVFDDGSGPALYAGGQMRQASGVEVNYLGKWNGSHWSALGTGMDNHVQALTTFDDGTGNALYAGGLFSIAGGNPAHFIAKWNGSSWSTLGSGMVNGVLALTVFDDGQGAALYPGGYFSSAAGSGNSYIAKWGNPIGCGTPGSPTCEPGVGGVIACPCGNAPASNGQGCNNSSNTGGAQLTATGIARLTYDTVTFTTQGEKPIATSIVLQGQGQFSSGVVFGQGVRCVAGALKRLYVKTASAGSITAPQATDLHVHARSASLGDNISPGTHRFYGVYYRDPIVLGGCPSTSTFNVTQQLDVLWGA